MPYSQFDIESIRDNFNITIIESVGTFATEKSRSEMVITPILLELKRLYPQK